MAIRMHTLTDQTGKTYQVSEGIFRQLLGGGAGDDTVPPGGTVRVPTMLTDGRPQLDSRFAAPTADQLQAVADARDEYIRWVSNAWRGDAAPPPVVDSAPRRSTPMLQPQPPHQPIKDERETAYREMCERISNAWRAGR